MVALLRLIPAVAVVAAFAVLAPSALGQGSASFAQLEGERGCLQAVGQEGNDPSCGNARALTGPSAAVVSPDQRHVYVAAGRFEGAQAITAFARDGETGALTFGSCISDSGGDGRTGTDGFCADGDALLGVRKLAFSPDGRFLYAASNFSHGLSWFERNAETGGLTQRGCLKEQPRLDRCGQALGLVGASDVAVSPDGKHLYATAQIGGELHVFTRDADTGALAPVMCISDTGSDGRCVNGTGLEGATSVEVAPDGRDVYVTALKVGAVTSYARDAATGRLTPRGCLLDEAPAGGSCESAPALAGAADAAITPDGRQLLVTSSQDSALSIFRRDPETGALEHSSCFAHQEPQGEDAIEPDFGEEDFGDEAADEADAAGCRPARALGGSSTLAISADGGAVFTSSPGDYLSAFQRDSSGRLEQFGCAEEERTYRACSQARILLGAVAVAASADGGNLYVVTRAGVAVFGASVAIASRSAVVSRRGAVRVKLACPRARRDACAGRVSGRRYRIAAGRSAWLRLRVPANVRRTARRRGRAHLLVVARDASRLTRPSVRRIVVRGRRAAARAATVPVVDLSFRTIERSSGAKSRLSEQRTIAIRTTRRWKQVWRQLHRGSTKKAPKVNFARYTLLLATQGQKPNSGYAIAIERVVLDGGEVTLHVVESEPDPAATHCTYLQVITNPYHVVRVRRTDRPIAPVQRRTQLVSC